MWSKTNWKITVEEIEKDHNIFFILERKIPIIKITEKKVFGNFEDAIHQVNEWMN